MSTCACGCGYRVRAGSTFRSGHNNRRSDAAIVDHIRSVVRVDEAGCWVWPGKVNNHGYGVYGDRGYVHRVFYTLTVGPIAEGLFVRHRCDNPPCCNPDHLELGTQTDNMRDMSERGRSHNGRKTHCHQGHEFTPENTYWRAGRGGRDCVTCRRERKKAHRAQARAEGRRVS